MGGFELVTSYIDLRSFLVCTGVFLFIFWYLRRPRNLPPGPWGVPVLGCLPTLTLALYKSGLRPHQLFQKFAIRYGNIFSMQIFGVNVVVLNSYDDIKAAFQNPNLNDRPPPSLFEELHFKPGVAIASGESWKHQRKFTLSTLRGFGVGKRSFEEQISTEANALVTEFLFQQGKPFNPRHFIGNAVSNVICSVIFGKRYEYSDEVFKHLLSLLNEQVKLLGAVALHAFVPIMKYLQPQTHKLVSDNFTCMFEFIEGIIDEHRLVHDPANPNDFIDVFLTETDPSHQIDGESYLNKEVLVTTIVNLFGAGSETTATTLYWGLQYITVYPDIQFKIQQEIDNIAGRNRTPQLSDKPKLPYTEAVLLEIQRISSVVPLGVMHRAAEATILKGFHIPKGTYLISNLWAVHNDPKVWEEPSKFRPSRFLDQSGNVQERAELIPFSIGRRICLGENLAKMELFLFFTHMLHRFTFTRPANSASIVFKGLGGAISSPEAFRIIATPRD